MLAPSDRAAVTNSRCPYINALARTRREVGAMATMPRAIDTVTTVFESVKFTMARASSSAGNERRTSIITMSTVSVLPRRYPAAIPTEVPIIPPKRIERKPTASEARAPQITREKMSRPRASVPNQNVALGARRGRPTIFAGSLIGNHGAVIAETTIRVKNPAAIQKKRPKRFFARAPST